MQFPEASASQDRGILGFGGHSNTSPGPHPPAYSAHPPSSGYRIPLSTDAPFPPSVQAGRAPCLDADGSSPVYFGSALFTNSVHPCKIAPHLGSTLCRVPYGGGEHEHRGRYDLLPFTDDMELIPASGGANPTWTSACGRRI
ncbi:hypothetical protein EW145_g2206 [Phellinidium pouzarii]|uniref:Uncharacterized protein n=1 Tax=Phellinidium pouzarii TaxID=167371 RepID=A0A4S4LH64_9AGAM|nr:hypothetical protein EW145_g2206 [Phellinidium pouzarii]